MIQHIQTQHTTQAQQNYASRPRRKKQKARRQYIVHSTGTKQAYNNLIQHEYLSTQLEEDNQLTPLVCISDVLRKLQQIILNKLIERREVLGTNIRFRISLKVETSKQFYSSSFTEACPG